MTQQNQATLGKMPASSRQQARYELIDQVTVAIVQLAARSWGTFSLAGPIHYQHLVACSH
ncbi:hypothetical protein D3C71_2171230 [compost metagenome]